MMMMDNQIVKSMLDDDQAETALDYCCSSNRCGMRPVRQGVGYFTYIYMNERRQFERNDR